MDKFEEKFVEFSRELTELTESNETLRDRERKLKRAI